MVSLSCQATSEVKKVMNMHYTKAAFFDRDGTLIKDVSYLSHLDQIELIPEVVPLCLNLQNNGYRIIVITNQSGIARGFFDEAFVNKTHEYLRNLFAQVGIFIEAFYFCPHHPTESVMADYKKECLCRKPQPGLLLQAARDLNLNLKESVMFGDRVSDLQAGLAAGCHAFFIHEALQWSQDQLFQQVNRAKCIYK
jgi:D-glycero-D-manno-heptose 1,7-bisphosphate phosphatase